MLFFAIQFVLAEESEEKKKKKKKENKRSPPLSVPSVFESIFPSSSAWQLPPSSPLSERSPRNRGRLTNKRYFAWREQRWMNERTYRLDKRRGEDEKERWREQMMERENKGVHRDFFRDPR